MEGELEDVGLEELKEAFRLFDQDDDGYITAKELGECIERLGEQASPSEISAIIASVNNGDSTRINFDQFVSVLTGAAPSPSPTAVHAAASPAAATPTSPAPEPEPAAAAAEGSTGEFKPLSEEEKRLLRKMIPSTKGAGTDPTAKQGSMRTPPKLEPKASPEARKGGLLIETSSTRQRKPEKAPSPASGSKPKKPKTPATPSPPNSGKSGKAKPGLKPLPSPPASSQPVWGMDERVQQLVSGLEAQCSRMEAHMAVSDVERRADRAALARIRSLLMLLIASNMVILLFAIMK